MSELYIKRKNVFGTYDSLPATPAEIAAAHPKCFTCGHWHYDTDDHSGDIGFCHFWTNEMGTTDYCPHHTELTGEKGGQESTD